LSAPAEGRRRYSPRQKPGKTESAGINNRSWLGIEHGQTRCNAVRNQVRDTIDLYTIELGPFTGATKLGRHSLSAISAHERVDCEGCQDLAGIL